MDKLKKLLQETIQELRTEANLLDSWVHRTNVGNWSTHLNNEMIHRRLELLQRAAELESELSRI